MSRYASHQQDSQSSQPADAAGRPGAALVQMPSGAVGGKVSSGAVGGQVSSGAVGGRISSGAAGGQMSSGAVGGQMSPGAAGGQMSSGAVGGQMPPGSADGKVPPNVGPGGAEHFVPFGAGAGGGEGPPGHRHRGRRPIPPKLYRMGEVVDYSGMSRQTIHNYTTMGLLPETMWTSGGHRLYDESVFERLDQIAELKARHKSMAYIREHFARLDRQQGLAVGRGQGD